MVAKEMALALDSLMPTEKACVPVLAILLCIFFLFMLENFFSIKGTPVFLSF